MNFEYIYQFYSQKVFRICMGYVNNKALAQDLTQEVFVKVWKNLSQFRNESSVDTWIFRIAVNTCLSQIEKNKKMISQELPENLVAQVEENFENEVRFLYQAIGELPEMDRIIISLELEDIPQKEIAQIVGITNANVRVKIHRIKEKLTLKFNNYGE